jgi:hypothetical protein
MKDITNLKDELLPSSNDKLDKYVVQKAALTHKIPDGSDYEFKPLAKYNPITRSYKVSYAGNANAVCASGEEVTIATPWGNNPVKLTAMYFNFSEKATGIFDVILKRPVASGEVVEYKDFVITSLDLADSTCASLINLDIWIDSSLSNHGKPTKLVVKNGTGSACDVIADFVFE